MIAQLREPALRFDHTFMFCRPLLSIAGVWSGGNLCNGPAGEAIGLRAIAVARPYMQTPAAIACKFHRDRTPTMIRICFWIVAERIQVPEVVPNRFKGFSFISPIF
jgi:hypothetical protein